MTEMYDSIIIGAGISGATAAYTLTQQNQKVLVLDKNGIATGGSGAAGAFVSPKIGKGSALQTLTNEAFTYTKDFYRDTCPEYFHQTGVIRIPKDEGDAQKFSAYEEFNDTQYENYTKEKLNSLGIDVGFDSFYFSDAGDCDALKVCEFLLRGIDVLKFNVSEIKRENGVWYVLRQAQEPSDRQAQESSDGQDQEPSGSEASEFLSEVSVTEPVEVVEVRAKNIVLATGYESDLVDLRYMGIRGTWGTRGDFKTHLGLKVSMHQAMSVGSNIDGIIKLGATHEKEVKDVVPCSEEQALNLKEKASSLIDTSDLELKEVFCGMRAGSKDYFPLVGQVIDVPYMLETYPAVVRGAKPALQYVDGLYVLNGLGGRGFVFAPLMAKMLAECISSGAGTDSRVNPDRLFLKWARKMNR